MATLSIGQALIIAIWVAIVMSRGIGYATLTLRFSPLMTGLVVGIVTGHITEAMIITAAIQLVYMGAVAPGGALPSEPAIAAAIAVTVAVLGDFTPEKAVAIAVPVGILGSYAYQFRFFLNTFALRVLDKYAADVNDRGIFTSVIIIPIVISFILYVPLVFIALYYGAPVVADFVNSISDGPIIHVLEVVGGGLAALGIAVIMHVIGKKELLLFFFLAYFMSVALKDLQINTVTYAIFGAILAGLYVLFTRGKEAA
ncbi:PTS sugar transporter subunit IIC [Niallia circulans]|jgi:D-glucosaminate PTS system EIIC component|uniref:PTS sorbose transporter subunit IIC n=1 Tax=Niallia circulans TaxID=1397 RepID=A0A0J1IKT4_NIACI|nr:PTS sugar transporter subunit IIC [Niallia circulans]AYV73479.1 PTS sugar transporter subunit IIC [Niallia circulans]KLV26577.1 PTS sorbose transporter subunit IIC [Niallia circulans]MCM2983428.1 PTS sugar transporter subunit IIC [Niallia circulans]MDR4317583.1 PTS sugar transporter subunit IIC [Niallia circulans]MED3841033.1 PTS sugar transporter subunit IIC [Niallia circulans]